MSSLDELWKQGEKEDPEDTWKTGATPEQEVILRKAIPQTPAPALEEELVISEHGPGKPGFLESGLQGLNSGVSGRLGPVIQGALGATLNPLLEKPKPRWEDEPLDDRSWLMRYREERDAAKGAEKAAAEANPATFGGSQLIGDIVREGATAVATGGASATPIGQGLTGAAMGAAETEGDLTTLEPGALAEGATRATIGGALGYGGGKLGQRYGATVAEKAGEFADWAGNKAAESAVKAAGAIKQHIRRMGLDKVREQGRALLDEALVKFGSSKEAIAERAQELLEMSGKKIGGMLELVDEATGKAFDWDRAAASIWRVFGLEFNPTEQRIIKPVIDDVMADLAEGKRIGGGFGLANGIKGTLQDTIGKYTDDPKTKGAMGNALNAMLKTVIDDQMEETFGRLVKETAQKSSASMTPEALDALEKMAGEAFGQNWLSAKRQYGIGKTAEDLTKHGIAQEIGNRWWTPSTYGTTMFGALMNPEAALSTKAIVGGTLGALNKIGLQRGRSAVAVTADQLSNAARALSESPNGARAVGGMLGGEAGRWLTPYLLRLIQERQPSAP